MGRGGSKAVWEFSKKTSSLGNPDAPKFGLKKGTGGDPPAPPSPHPRVILSPFLPFFLEQGFPYSEEILKITLLSFPINREMQRRNIFPTLS